MQATQSAVTDNEYRNLPITALVESANNPRKRFDGKSLEELAAAIGDYFTASTSRVASS
jgi:hypothetical protein